MGPRSFERGDRPQHVPECFVVQAFNGAALFRARRLRPASWNDRPSANLQWGRALSSAETDPIRLRLDNPGTPSMGPRSFERGDHHQHPLPTTRYPPFNGAALFRARRPATFRRSSKPGRAFNGAALFRARRPIPRPGRAFLIPTFNGAALFRARRQCASERESKCAGGFNGAALFRARRPRRTSGLGARHTHLQWGRALSSAETRLQAVQTDQSDNTLQWGRALSSAETRNRVEKKP